MPRGDSSLNMLIVAAILALGVGYYVPQTFSAKPAVDSAKATVDAVRIGKLGQVEDDTQEQLGGLGRRAR